MNVLAEIYYIFFFYVLDTKMKHTLQQEATRFCAGLRSRNEEAKMKAAAELKAFVATDLREHGSEDTKAFYEKINNEIHEMINNGDAVDKRGGILGIGK